MGAGIRFARTGWNYYGQTNTPSNATGVTQFACGALHTYAFSLATDANRNNRPDSCDLLDDPTLDRDGNGVIDALDIQRIPALDCNTNGLLDLAADLADHPEWDCDLNARVDTCDYADGAPDDNLDGHLDSCSYAKGDFDLSAEVDTGDLSVLLLYMGEVDSPIGDLDGDGTVTTADVSLLLLNFGPVTWP